MSVTRKLLIFMLGIALPPVLALISFTYIELQRSTADTAVSHLEDAADRQETRLNQMYYNLREKATSYANRSELRIEVENDRSTVQINDILRRYKQESDEIDTVSIVDPTGVVLYSTEEKRIQTIAFQGFTVDKFPVGFYYQYTDVDGEHMYFLSQLGQGGNATEYILLEANFSTVSAVLRDYSSLEKTGETVLAKAISADEYRYIGQSRNQTKVGVVVTISPVLPMVKALDKREITMSSTTDYRGKNVIAVTRYVDVLGWGMVVKIDKEEVFERINKLLVSYSLITVIAILVVIISSTYFSRKLMLPLLKLNDITKKIKAKGDWQQTIDIYSNDEFGELARNFEDMTKKMALLYSEMDDKVNERTAELSSNVLELEKFKLAVEHASDHIVITDRDGYILYANEAVEKITGFDNRKIIGQKAGSSENWGGVMDKEFYRRLWHTIGVEKRTFYGELQNKKKNGEVYTVLENIAPIKDEDGEVKFYVSIERDISKEKEIDRSKSEFVNIASHQLRTPLSTIKWYTEMMLDGDAGKLTSEQMSYLHEIEVGSKRMVELVNALLNVSRLELGNFAVDPVPQSLKKIALEIIKESHLLIKQKHLEIVTDIDELPDIPVDKGLMSIVFQNLISNAIKYTLDGGKIQVRIFTRENNVIIEVIDSGIGIPIDQQDKIFTKLFRARNATEQVIEGTGLGLYIVKSILDNTGGKLSFISRVGVGSTFTVKLPLTGMKSKEGPKKLE